MMSGSPPTTPSVSVDPNTPCQFDARVLDNSGSIGKDTGKVAKKMENDQKGETRPDMEFDLFDHAVHVKTGAAAVEGTPQGATDMSLLISLLEEKLRKDRRRIVVLSDGMNNVAPEDAIKAALLKFVLEGRKKSEPVTISWLVKGDYWAKDVYELLVGTELDLQGRIKFRCMPLEDFLQDKPNWKVPTPEERYTAMVNYARKMQHSPELETDKKIAEFWRALEEEEKKKEESKGNTAPAEAKRLSLLEASQQQLAPAGHLPLSQRLRCLYATGNNPTKRDSSLVDKVLAGNGYAARTHLEPGTAVAMVKDFNNGISVPLLVQLGVKILARTVKGSWTLCSISDVPGDVDKALPLVFDFGSGDRIGHMLDAAAAVFDKTPSPEARAKNAVYVLLTFLADVDKNRRKALGSWFSDGSSDPTVDGLITVLLKNLHSWTNDLGMCRYAWWRGWLAADHGKPQGDSQDFGVRDVEPYQLFVQALACYYQGDVSGCCYYLSMLLRFVMDAETMPLDSILATMYLKRDAFTELLRFALTTNFKTGESHSNAATEADVIAMFLASERLSNAMYCASGPLGDVVVDENEFFRNYASETTAKIHEGTTEKVPEVNEVVILTAYLFAADLLTYPKMSAWFERMFALLHRKAKDNTPGSGQKQHLCTLFDLLELTIGVGAAGAIRVLFDCLLQPYTRTNPDVIHLAGQLGLGEYSARFRTYVTTYGPFFREPWPGGHIYDQRERNRSSEWAQRLEKNPDENIEFYKLAAMLGLNLAPIADAKKLFRRAHDALPVYTPFTRGAVESLLKATCYICGGPLLDGCGRRSTEGHIPSAKYIPPAQDGGIVTPQLVWAHLQTGTTLPSGPSVQDLVTFLWDELHQLGSTAAPQEPLDCFALLKSIPGFSGKNLDAVFAHILQELRQGNYSEADIGLIQSLRVPEPLALLTGVERFVSQRTKEGDSPCIRTWLRLWWYSKVVGCGIFNIELTETNSSLWVLLFGSTQTVDPGYLELFFAYGSVLLSANDALFIRNLQLLPIPYNADARKFLECNNNYDQTSLPRKWSVVKEYIAREEKTPSGTTFNPANRATAIEEQFARMPFFSSKWSDSGGNTREVLMNNVFGPFVPQNSHDVKVFINLMYAHVFKPSSLATANFRKLLELIDESVASNLPGAENDMKHHDSRSATKQLLSLGYPAKVKWLPLWLHHASKPSKQTLSIQSVDLHSLHLAGLPILTWAEAQKSTDALVQSVVQSLLDPRNVLVHS